MKVPEPANVAEPQENASYPGKRFSFLTKSRRMKLLGMCGLLCVAVPGLWQASIPSAPLDPYRYVTIADSRSDPYRSFHPVTAIDEQGMAMFRANLANGEQGIFMGNEAGRISIAETNGAFQMFRGTPALSRNGKVVFLSDTKSGEVGYFRGSNPEHDFIYGHPDFEDIGDVAVNNQGTVAFKAKRKKGREKRRQVFLGNGGKPKAVPESAHSMVGVPHLNEKGAVVFSTGARVYLSDGNTTLSILKKDKEYFLFHRPVINDKGAVLVQSSLKTKDGGMEKRLMLIENGERSVVASTEGSYAEFYSAHSLNNHGDIAFSALLDSGIAGIFTGPDPGTDTVIRQGDELAGSRILEGPVLSNHGLNDEGMIVFFARLEDDSEGIFVAKPHR